MQAPLLFSDELFQQMGTELPAGQTPELVFAEHLLKREGIALARGQTAPPGLQQDAAARCPLKRVKIKVFRHYFIQRAGENPENRKDRTTLDSQPPLLGYHQQLHKAGHRV